MADPFADFTLANLSIGGADDAQKQQQAAPSFDIWGLQAPAAPAPAPTQAPPAPQAPPPVAAPPPVFAPPPVAAPPPVLAPPPVAVPPPVAAPTPAQAPIAGGYDPFAVFGGAPAPAPASPTSDPFASNPFGAITKPVAPSHEADDTHRDDSPTHQRPADAPAETVKVQDDDDATLGSTADASHATIEDDDADFWAQMGFAVEAEPTPAAGARPGMGGKRMSIRASIVRTVPKAATAQAPQDLSKLDENGLPQGGEYYKVTLPAGQFGAVFFRGEEMADNLYATAPKSFAKTLKNRPVLGYTSSDSIVDKAGVSVGDVIVKVDKNDVDTPKSALYLIRKTAAARHTYRAIELTAWKPPPSVNVSLAENQCMTEYHIINEVPPTSFDWKSKYVVVGGVVSEPWVINMYYGKRDYDIAVSEINAKRPKVSIKVKSWSLIGARLLTPKPRKIHYSTKNRPWYYIVVKTHKGKTIKISHPVLDGLKPIIEGVKRAIEHTKTYQGF